MVVTSYPGVYIEEFAPGAPIQGVGTSTPAFLGPAADGPLNVPTRITSWDVFKSTFGQLPLDGFYLWYAVRGFFENGGTTCYVTRVSNATFDTLPLDDQTNTPTIVLTARQPGPSSPTISVAVVGDVHAVPAASAKLYRPTAPISTAAGTSVTVDTPDHAAQFRQGDRITWNGSTESQPVIVSHAEGATIRLVSPLSGTYSTGTVRLVDLAPGDTVLRVEGGAKLSAGSVIELVQTNSSGPDTEDVKVVARVEAERVSPSLTTYRVTLRQGLAKAFELLSTADDTTVESQEFKVTVTQGSASAVYDELGMDPEHVNYYASVINGDATGVVTAAAVSPPNVTPPPDNRPKDVTPAADLTGGKADSPATLAPSDYIHSLDLLKPIRDVNMVAIPDRTDMQVQIGVIDHCTLMQDRFAILDSRRGAPLFGTDSVELQRAGLDTARGFAALYYPWMVVGAATGSGTTTVPPSGHVAGIYARTDNARGVHKAPAGNEALVNGALAVERTMSDTDQGILNLEGINVVRVFTSGGRPVVWGARTTSTDTNWQYVNIRRLFLYVEGSIEQGIRWAVFEPNNQALWQKLKRTITEFLTRVWRDGALFGVKAEEAFYVRIDDALNPFSEQQLGRLHIEIGLRPSYPAEFVVVRIGIWPGGSEISES